MYFSIYRAEVHFEPFVVFAITVMGCSGPVAQSRLETIPAKSGDNKRNKRFEMCLGAVGREIHKFVERGGQSLENTILRIDRQRGS